MNERGHREGTSIYPLVISVRFNIPTVLLLQSLTQTPQTVDHTSRKVCRTGCKASGCVLAAFISTRHRRVFPAPPPGGLRFL